MADFDRRSDHVHERRYGTVDPATVTEKQLRNYVAAHDSE
ncbi:hypothetical protein PAMC26577_11455 [Caballeronia sordidicola]|uniref:Uncharacterized protein n=1 Tax=Caballeronia sordidicola TaxID=196367 RepID=A0A242MXS0_CABSO|nr:hypothetical protein PAMC26577_11455 [Caballeronia sordidicola]